MLSSPSPAIAVIAIGKIQYRRQKKDYRKQNPVFIRVQKRKNRKYHDQYTHYDMKYIQGKRDIRAFLSFFLQVQRIHSLLIFANNSFILHIAHSFLHIPFHQHIWVYISLWDIIPNVRRLVKKEIEKGCGSCFT